MGKRKGRTSSGLSFEKQTLKSILKKAILVAAIALVPMRPDASAQEVDIFLGADLNYRRLFFNERLYDLLIYARPGVKVNFGENWQVAGEALVPVVNQYGDFYGRIRPGICSVSKEFLTGGNVLKLSAGLFSAGRYGLDMKCLFPVSDWFAVESQIGFTGYHSLEQEWKFSTIDRLTGNIKARFFLKEASSEIRISGGRYIYEDYGGQTEFYSHFNFTSIGLYLQYSTKAEWGAGAKVVFMLPLQKNRRYGKVNLRPSSNFRLTYDVMADSFALKNYMTDPEENERTGSFRALQFPEIKEK